MKMKFGFGVGSRKMKLKRIKVSGRSIVSIILIFCLLQVFACDRQKSADDGGLIGKLVQETLYEQGMEGKVLCPILSELMYMIESTKFLSDDAMERGTDKESGQASDQFIMDSTENIASGGKGESLFDAYEIDEKEYLYFDDDAHLHVAICYPQLHGFYDIEKEKKVNQLIEEEAKRMIPQDLVDVFSSDSSLVNEYPDYIMGLYLLYEIKYMNEDIVSIFYKGLRGRIDSGYRPKQMAMATTIDLENAEVIKLTDIIIDLEELSTMLLDDQFENISIWDGVPSTTTISSEYGGVEAQKELLEALSGSHEYRVIEWYIGGSNLVIMTVDNYYEEYSKDLDSCLGLVDENFREKLQKK